MSWRGLNSILAAASSACCEKFARGGDRDYRKRYELAVWKKKTSCSSPLCAVQCRVLQSSFRRTKRLTTPCSCAQRRQPRGKPPQLLRPAGLWRQYIYMPNAGAVDRSGTTRHMKGSANEQFIRPRDANGIPVPMTVDGIIASMKASH